MRLNCVQVPFLTQWFATILSATGYFKTWTVDSGLDCGLRCWRPLPAVECLYLSCNWRRSLLFTAGSIYDLAWSFRNLQRMILVRPGLADMMCTLTRRLFWLWSYPRLSVVVWQIRAIWCTSDYQKVIASLAWGGGWRALIAAWLTH